MGEYYHLISMTVLVQFLIVVLMYVLFILYGFNVLTYLDFNAGYVG